VLGECFAQKPAIFLDAREKLKDKIVHFAYVDSFDDYAAWLWQADILPVTSLQDFFGGSVIQALYCNCYPLLPERLSYPEHIPDAFHSMFFYSDFDDLAGRLQDLLLNIHVVRQESIQHFVTKYDWQTMAPRYDQTFEAML
jgi:glycosyltransferase involved in cell wall biosynthesis